MKDDMTVAEESQTVALQRSSGTMTTLKQAIILSLSGAITAIVLLTVVEGMFRAELGASRKLVQQANETTQHIDALVTRLDYAASRELEFATNLDRANHRFSQLFFDQSTNITNGFTEVQQAARALAFEAKDTRLSMREVHDKVIMWVQQSGEVNTALQQQFQETRASLAGMEAQIRQLQHEVSVAKSKKP